MEIYKREIDETFVLSFPESKFAVATKTHADELEDAFFCTGYHVTRKGKIVSGLVRYLIDPNDSEIRREKFYIEPGPASLCKLYTCHNKCRTDFILLIHWHKFTDNPYFSSIDDTGAYALYRDGSRINPKTRIIQVVFSKNKHFAARYFDGKRFIYFNKIKTIGPSGIQKLHSTLNNSQVMNQKIPEGCSLNEMFIKNVLAFGEAGVKKIAELSVVIIGCGGLGSAIVYQLARLGVTNITLIDFDKITLDNCNRLYFVDKVKSAVGKAKSKYLARKYKKFNPKSSVKYYIGSGIDKEAVELINLSDLVVLTVDNDSTRVIVNDICSQYLIPLINIGTGLKMNEDGTKLQNSAFQIQWYFPGDNQYPCIKCHGSLDWEKINNEITSEFMKKEKVQAGYIIGTNISPTPQVVTLNTIAAGTAVWSIVGWVVGFKKPLPWMYYDVMTDSVKQIKVNQDISCTSCSLSELSRLATGDSKFDLEVKHGKDNLRPNT